MAANKKQEELRLHYSKDVCFRVRVSRENQGRMKKQLPTSLVPLFELKQNEHLNLRFEYNSFTCSYQKETQTFSYKDILRVETEADGVILYLNNDAYLYIAAENTEKHNSALYDIVLLLKRRCRSRFAINTQISYPNDHSERYQADLEPTAEIAFVLTDRELKRMLWYDYLFDERMIVFIIPAILLLILSAVLFNVWLFAGSAAIAIFCFFLSRPFFETADGYIKNHRGRLLLLMHEKVLIVRLRDTDLELEYSTMKRKKDLFGLFRLRSGDFFVLILPKRIERENPAFFHELYKKINISSRKATTS